MRQGRLSGPVLVFLLACGGLLLASSPAAAQTTVHTGTIASGAQFDLYTSFLIRGTRVEARLICEELVPGSRPLDPVLSMYFPGGGDPTDVATADAYNDDGFGSDDDPEGVDCNAFDSSRLILVTPRTGTYTFRADGFGSSTGPYSLSIAIQPTTDLDFDGDLTADLAVFRQSTGGFFVRQSTDDTTEEVCCGNPAIDVPVGVDFDGDFKTDVGVFRASSGGFLFLRSTDGVLDARGFGAAALPTDRSAVADYDGDGLADAAIYRPSAGVLYIKLTTNGLIVQRAFANPAAGDVPIPADYDGDGLADAAIFRASGQFSIQRSSDGVPAELCCASPGAGDVPSVADYDGDFKADLAVYRRSLGTFFAIPSATGIILATPLVPPDPSDRPVSSDYDGDGKADYGVLRAANGIYYIRRSSDGLLIFQTGPSPAAGDVPVK
jgi:hypothetical protein